MQRLQKIVPFNCHKIFYVSTEDQGSAPKRFFFNKKNSVDFDLHCLNSAPPDRDKSPAGYHKVMMSSNNVCTQKKYYK